ncbi:ribosome small subunit-dependent GTPase A [Endothiovibrio diazotrophicus]
MSIELSLGQLGWRPFFQQQLHLDEWGRCAAARVFERNRSNLLVVGEAGQRTLPLAPSMPPLTVGDWLLLDGQDRFVRPLERFSLFSRRAAGEKVAEQLIAANVDTLFVVSSLNLDFNLSRIERYLALANEAGVEAVVVLTKADLVEAPFSYVERLRAIDPLLMVEAVNALEAASVAALSPWCGEGQTVALLGSSGVGKSTLVNTLLGHGVQATGAIRADDDKGRHTTTARSLHPLPGGALLLDTPGMRELQLADCASGVEETFRDIVQLAAECRFADCAHQGEPGCAVRTAIEAGRLEERRLTNYFKLLREQALNSATLAEKRQRDRDLGRFYRSVLNDSLRKKGR